MKSPWIALALIRPSSVSSKIEPTIPVERISPSLSIAESATCRPLRSPIVTASIASLCVGIVPSISIGSEATYRRWRRMRSRIVSVRVYVAKGTGSDSRSVSRTFETSVAIVFMRMERKRRRSRIITTIAPPKPAARRVESGSIQHQSQPKNTRSVHQGLQTIEGVRPI